MKSKTKNNKVPKSAKTKLSDLTPRKDTRGGKWAPGINDTGPIGRTPAIVPPQVGTSRYKKQATA
jgi:hypothetical protein